MQLHYKSGNVPLVLLYSDSWAHLFCICDEVKWISNTTNENLVARLDQEHLRSCPSRTSIQVIEIWPINVDKLRGS